MLKYRTPTLQSKPYLSQTEKDNIRQSVDNFIVNPCDTTLLEFKNLFDLKEIVYDAYSLPASLMDASSKEKMKFRMNVYCEQTPYAKFLIEVLSESAISLVEREPEEGYKNIPAHTKLSQMITQPHIFKHILKIENLIENGKEQTNAVLSAVFFHEVMASSDIEPHVKLRNHINYKYNLFDYNAKQSIFLLTYAPYEELKEALEYLNTNKVAMYATFLKDKILHKSDNKIESKEKIEKVADFLKNFAIEKTKIYDENLSEEKEIEKIVNYLVDCKSQLDLMRLDTEAELQIYFCLWAFAFTNTSADYRHEVLKQYIENSESFFVEEKENLSDFMANHLYYKISLPPKKETTYRDIKEKLRDLHGMGELGVFINTLIKHTTRNKAEKEKAELEHKLELFMPLSPEPTHTYSKTKQKI